MEAIRHLERAWARRAGKLGHETNAFRLFNGANEGIPGLVIEIFLPVAIFQIHTGKFNGDEMQLTHVANWCLSQFGLKAVYLKEFVADRSHEKENAKLKEAAPFSGEAVPPEITVLENGHSFLIRPYDGFSCGLFLDQRDNRKFLAENVKDKNVLNCFAYTCGFSVYAAKAGAKTTSVDLSKRFLEWGKKNFIVNGIEEKGHRFIAGSVFDYAKKAGKRKECYDLIILDPPSFSRDKKGKTWSIEKDYKKLLEAVLPLLSPSGRLFFSSNFSEWSQKDFTQRLGKAGLAFKPMKLPKVAVDFEKAEHQLLAGLWEKPI